MKPKQRRRKSDWPIVDNTSVLRTVAPPGVKADPDLADFFATRVSQEKADQILLESVDRSLKEHLRRLREFENIPWTTPECNNAKLLLRIRSILESEEITADSSIELISLLGMIRTRLMIFGEGA